MKKTTIDNKTKSTSRKFILKIQKNDLLTLWIFNENYKTETSKTTIKIITIIANTIYFRLLSDFS